MSRGQSESLGSLLLVAIVVLLMSTVGYYYLGSIGGQDGPTANIDGTVTASTVTFSHGGGDAIPGDELTVVLRYDGTEQRDDFETAGHYGDDDVFEPGEQWRLDGAPPYDAGDRVEVLLVHDPSGTVLFHGERVATTPTATATPASKVTPPPADAVTATPEPPNEAPVADAGSDVSVSSPTDGSGDVRADGRGVRSAAAAGVVIYALDGGGSPVRRTSVTLDGSGSYDPDGDAIDYEWHVSSHGGLPVNAAELASNRGERPAFVVTRSVTGSDHTVTVELTVTDAHGATDTDTVNVTVEKPDTKPPTVDRVEVVRDDSTAKQWGRLQRTRADFTVAANVSDDRQLASVNVTVSRLFLGVIPVDTTVLQQSVGGTADSVGVDFTESGYSLSDRYLVEVTVTDATGRQSTTTIVHRVTVGTGGNGNGNGHGNGHGGRYSRI
ncbi:MAG: type IV pilin [Haloplanus sp.]